MITSTAVRAIVSEKGVFLVYSTPTEIHIRLLGDISDEGNAWVAYPLNGKDWLWQAIIHIKQFESTFDVAFTCCQAGREDAWKLARASIVKLPRSVFFLEYHREQAWTVVCCCPIASA